MEQNNMRKYVWYAFGEIMLVMVGILLALQVNNWNEQKKAKIEERILLQNLQTDFQTRNKELADFTVIRNQTLLSIQKLSTMIVEPDSILSLDEMNLLMVPLNNLILFNDQFKVLDVIFSTGKIDNISNRELKILLLNWPQDVEEMMEEQRIRYDVFSQYFLPLQYKYLSLRPIFEEFTFRGYEYSSGYGRKKKANYPALLEDPIFENYLAQVEVLHRINDYDYKVLLTNSGRIIELLEEELEDKN